MTPDDLLRDLATDLPFERPTAARRDAIRSSLLVEAAESIAARPTATRRWPVALAFAAGALAAAAIAVIVVRRPAPVEHPNLAQVTATSPDVRIEHRVVATDTGVDEIVQLRDGTVALAIPAQRRGDRVRIQTVTAEVEGDAGELEVVVVADQLQSVRVKAGTARVIVVGQTPVTLSAGQTWRASVITTDLSPAKVDPVPKADPVPVVDALANPIAVTTIDPPAPALAIPPPPTPNGVTTAARGPTFATPTNPTGATPTKSTIATRTPTIATPTNPTPNTSTAARAPTGATPTIPTIATRTPPTTATPTPDGGKPSLVVEAPVAVPTVVAPVKGAKPSIEQQFQQGFALLKAGKAREAATELGAAADASPDAPLAADARYFQAVALVRANDPRAAERVLVQFLDTAPKSLRRGRAAVLLGRLLSERGDARSARAWLETAANDPDPAIAAAAKAGLQTLPK